MTSIPHASELIHQVRPTLSADAPQGASVSQYLAAAIAEHLRAGEPSPESLRQSFRADRSATLDRLLPRAAAWFRGHLAESLAALRTAGLLPAGLPGSLFAEEQYRERIIHLALERLLVNPAAPPLLISPVPDPEWLHPLRAGRVLAVLFDHPLAITHELYPLCTDAYVFSLNEPSAAPFALVGVHNSWIDSRGRAGRAILFHPELDLFLETPLSTPLTLAAGLLICQSPESHRCLAARLAAVKLPHVNTRDLAAASDDKWGCFESWKRSEVPTPPTCLLEQRRSPEETRKAILAFIRACARHRHGWVIQPRRGTEGNQVAWVAAEKDAADALLQAWRGIVPADDAILRPRVGLVCLQSPDGPQPFDLRVHVAFDGAGYAVESGYLQVAPAAAAPISSTARGGRIRPLCHLAETALVCLTDPGEQLRWTPEIAAAARDLAVRAAQAVGPLGWAGVDIKFDYREGHLHPSVLDLNPRPAGLLHANLFAGGEAGIGAALWRGLLSCSATSAQDPHSDRSPSLPPSPSLLPPLSETTL